MSLKYTACPLDCYDACSVVYENGKLKADKNHPITQGFLCPSLNSYMSTKRLEHPTLNGSKISMDKALEILVEKLKEYKDQNSIYFKSNGNFGKLQNVTKEFFSRYGSTFTKGSLCDSSGEAGILRGRGANYLLSHEQIQNSDVVVVWGRNIDTTNSHLVKSIENKKLIVIDPVKTNIAKRADIHLQIRPRSDLELSILFSRLSYAYIDEDEKYLQEYSKYYDDYIDFTQGFRLNELTKKCDVDIGDVTDSLELILESNTVFLVGVGVQKYSHGDEVLRAIDSLAMMFNLFGKKASGVGYLADSSIGFINPFSESNKQVPISSVDFSQYSFTFIQGANPASQMPNSKRVRDGIKKSKFSVYFGLYENDTSRCCNLVIPAKNFLQKDDIRFSYGHHYIFEIPKVEAGSYGISEYELCSFLMKKFDYGVLKDEKEYIDIIKNSNSKSDGKYLVSKSYEQLPYQDGFYTDDKKFVFLDELEDDYEEEEGYWLLSAKPKHSINSQFKCDDWLYVPVSLNLCDGDKITLFNEIGSCEYEIKVDTRLRDDCLLLYSGAKNLNMLTSHTPSNEGFGAVYQELKVKIKI